MKKPTKAQRVLLRWLGEPSALIYEPPAGENHYCVTGQGIRLLRRTLYRLRDRGWIETDHTNPFGEIFWRATDAGREAIK